MSAPISVLIIDDSAANRRAITEALAAVPDVQVVGWASDGEAGLKQAMTLRPDVITLDLEMPRLDGFSFLRLLMAQAPTPVIVISSYTHHSDVFKALELGAFDFIPKPGRGDVQLVGLREALLERVRAVRMLGRGGSTAARRATRAVAPSGRVIGVGASTGGPPAIQRLLEALGGQPLCLLISQHMPPRFTGAFAERLDGLGAFAVCEARDGDPIEPGKAYVAPGGGQLVVGRDGGALVVRTPAARPEDVHHPSVDRLFESLAEVLGAAAFGVVLTGMGADGARGARAIAGAGGEVWAEAEETAVIFGMPKEAIATGAVQRVLPLHALGAALVERLATGR